MNELQRSYKNWEGEIKESYPPVIAEVLKNLEGGLSVDKAVDKAFKSTQFLELIENKTVQSVMASSQLGLGATMTLNTAKASDYYLFTKFANGVNLKETIWDGQIQGAVKSSVQEYLKFKGNVLGLTKEISKVATPQAKLPKVLDELLSITDKAGSKELSSKIKQAKRQIAKLSERGYSQNRVKPIYSKLVDAVEKGVSGSALDRVVQRAFDRKVQYLNSRVARTEMARAYGMSFYRRVEQDDGIIAVRWTLSSGHPQPDICDFFHEANVAGWGDGIYPVSMLPSFPAHSNCLCGLVSIRDDPDNPLKNGRYSNQRSIDYLASLDEKKRGQIIGVANAKDKSKWLKALEDKGFSVGTKKPMTAKKVIEELEPKVVKPKISSVADVEQELRNKHGIENINIADADFISSKAILASFDNMQDRGFLNPYKTVETSPMFSNTYANSNSERMRLNKTLFSDSLKLTEMVGEDIRIGWHPYAEDKIESLIIHEYAHGLSNKDIKGKTLKGGTFEKIYNRYKAKLGDIENSYKETKKQALKSADLLSEKGKQDYRANQVKNENAYKKDKDKYTISTYGTIGAKKGGQLEEFVAEGFTDYVSNGNGASPYSAEVYNLMKTLYTK